VAAIVAIAVDLGAEVLRLERHLKDYARASKGLFWQRQATFAGATLLAAYYVNVNVALICYGICQLTEFADDNIATRVLKWDGQGEGQAERFQRQLTLSGAFCSIAVVQYIILIALVEGPSLHLGPLVFLISAALYSAMNNCQIPRVLVTRMTIYTAAFVFIPIYDLWIVRPPLDSELWKQLGIVLFGLYFLIECSRKFAEDYKTRMMHMEDLRVERDRVTEAYKTQSQFVSIVSHELRTPLTSIKASLDILNCGKLGSLPDKLTNVAKIGQENSNRLAILIDDLLDFQKLEFGQLALQFEPVDLGNLVRKVVTANQPFADTRNLTIQMANSESQICVYGDPDRLMQILTNVLSNAFKFSHLGGTIDVSIESSKTKGRILVRDNGIGIPKNSESTVFDPFSQVDGSNTRESGGTGLGMSIAKKIMEGHGGDIYYSSEEGIGTTFFVELDLLPDSEETVAQAPCSKHECLGPDVRQHQRGSDPLKPIAIS